MAIDIFKPLISQVTRDMEGKTFLIYGTNSTGKTKQATRLKKPLYLMFEAGLDAISGVQYFVMNEWSDFVSTVKQLTPRNPEKRHELREKYQTVIVDEASIIAQLCADYICERFGLRRVGEGGNGYGLWDEYSKAFETQLRRLTVAGYTVVFLAHDGLRKELDKDSKEKYEKIYPAGDKRIMDPIINIVDFVIYLENNGVDPETGDELLSSAYICNSKAFKSRTRFSGCPKYLPEFTAEALEEAVAIAVAAEEKQSGVNAVTVDEVQNKIHANTSPVYSYEELVEQIREIAMTMQEEGKRDVYTRIVEEHLGVGKGVRDTTPNQLQVLKIILSDLQEETNENPE